MSDIIWLIFAHFIGDIALQSPWQAENKGQYWYVMFSHCMIWTACISIALEFVGAFAIWKVGFLVLGHAFSDLWKSRQPKTPEHWWKIYPDQAWHLIQCLVVYIL
ncbi:DUF3307 domain-containing protein [Candidatus Pacearchaeota archaeon]|nr:DUF3307 domain-containing protein [Candidatus Pacearchaeota archaeon]